MTENPKELNVLAEASEIIYGDREKTYGKPSKNLDVIANLWNSYLVGRITAEGYHLNAQDVALMMVLLKIARLANTPNHHDSLVDSVGYLALIDRINNDY